VAISEAADHRLAAQLCADAGRLLVELRAGDLDGTALGDAGDRAAHELLAAALAAARPNDGLLSEEGDHDPGQHDRGRHSTRPIAPARTWIVDPLDGTREYRERPRTDWAVHVALSIAGTAVIGAVALPALGMVLSTANPPPPPPQPGPSPRLVVSRSRPPAFTETLRAALGGTVIEMGSAGAKAMAVVRGEADVYAHAGGMYEWDSAAPVAVAAAAGLHVSRLDGSPLVYDQPDPWLPDLLICAPALAATVIEVCADATRGDPAS
jgi:3'(2'), 5'-bisphosphate nucleotidase